MKSFRHSPGHTALALAGMLASLSAIAQTYPSKPVRVIVPYTPGATTEVARIITLPVAEVLGQSFVIDSRPGGGGTIGTQLVARAAPDGYTLLYSTAGNLIQAPFMLKDVPFNAITDFTPIISTSKTVGILSINPSVPVNNVKELIEWSKRNPGKLTISNPGVGSAYYMGVELLNKLTGTTAINVPFKGGAEGVTAVVGGQVTASISSVTTTSVFVKQGKLKLLAVIESSRYSRLPNLPTVGETVPGFALPLGWHGILGPAGLPRPIVTQLHAEVVKSVKNPDVEKRMEGFGLDVAIAGPEEYAGTIKADYELFAKVVKLLDIKPE